LLKRAGLIEVTIAERSTTYSVPDTEALWHRGLGSRFDRRC
jgi:hypothetical protein